MHIDLTEQRGKKGNEESKYKILFLFNSENKAWQYKDTFLGIFFLPALEVTHVLRKRQFIVYI